MKRILFAGLVMASMSLQAQDTYLNDRMINTGNDVYGTSRYVGMGGAMGALGADISTMSFNPAGIGLYRKTDIAFTTGALWNAHKVEDVKNARGTLDQFGVVYSARLDHDKVRFINLGFNYQRRINFGSAFTADNIGPKNLNGLSQMDQLAELANFGYDTEYNLAGAASYYGMLSAQYDAQNKVIPGTYFNKYNGEESYYTHSQHGGLNAFDINLSGNVNDRVYFGVTVGFDNLNYRAETDYFEKSSCEEDGVVKYGDYSLYNDYKIDGWGMNLKFGLIARPIEESPLRIGLAMETPTWYQVESSTLYRFADMVDNVYYPSIQVDKRDFDEAFMNYSMHSPVKGRLSIGSTVGNYLAWDVDYEFGNYGKTGMGYPKNFDIDGSARLFGNETDKAMNRLTRETLGFQHTVRAGLEWKPTTEWAVRLGYNFSSSPYKDKVSFDQCYLDSYAMDYATNTSFMKMKSTNIITLGLGYKYKKFYADLAYKVRAQKADFYAFDDSFNTKTDSPVVVDANNVPVALSPVEVNMARHQLTATLGFKF